jgi:hypothetical protein
MKKKPVRRTTKLQPTDKWIVGMVCEGGAIQMFNHPKVHTNYDLAMVEAEARAQQHGKPFVVFAKKAVFSPFRPPVTKQEYSA